MIRHSVLAFQIAMFAGAVQLHAQHPAAPRPYPAKLLQKLEKAERPTTTKGEFADYLHKRFQVDLPGGAKVENFFAQVGFRAGDWDTVIWEYYAKIGLTPEQLTGFCKAWRHGPKPKGQLRVYEEDESLPTIGGLPAPAQTPVQVAAWMKAKSPWVFCYLEDGQTGAVIMRVSKKTNHIHLWAYEVAKEKQAEVNYFKVQIRGTVRVKGGPPKTGVPELDNQPFSATIHGNSLTPHLFFGGDEQLLATARKLDGKPVVLNGEMRRFIGGTISGLDERPPPLVYYVKVTTLQAVEAQGADGELRKLQGTWVVMDLEYEGKKEPEDIVKALQVVIKDDMFTLNWMGLPNQTRFKVNPAPTPRVIDLIDPKDETRITEWGIYQWQGDDQLMLCVRAWRQAPAFKERPKDFESKKPGSALTLMVLKRKATPVPKAAQGPGTPVQKPGELKEALVGKWVSDDADKIPVEFGADGSFRLAVSKSIGSSYPGGWKWETAEGTYAVSDEGKVRYQAKLGRLAVKGHFTMKDGVLIGPLGLNAAARWKKVPQGPMANGPPPAAPERDPEKVFHKACELVAALEGKHDLLKGVSKVKPDVQWNEQKRLKSAHLAFANNAVPPGKNAAKAKDDSQPFFYVSVEVWSGRTQSPPGNLHEFAWQGQTYQMWVRVYGSDAELVKMVRKSVDEALREPLPPNEPPSGKWPGSRSSLQALAPVTTTVLAAVTKGKAEITSRNATHMSTRMTLGKGEVIEGGGFVFFAQCRQKFQVLDFLHGNGKPGDRVLEYGIVEKTEGFPLPGVQEPLPAGVKVLLLMGEQENLLKALPDTHENRKAVRTALSEQKRKSGGVCPTLPPSDLRQGPRGAPSPSEYRDPEAMFRKAREGLVALEVKHDLLKGVAEVKPVVEHDEKGRLKSVRLVFERNAMTQGKGSAKAKDEASPFVYVAIEVWAGRTQSPQGGLHEFEWKGQTYQMWERAFSSNPELVKAIHKAVDVFVLEPPQLTFRLETSQSLEAYRKGEPLVFEGQALDPIHRSGPEHFKLTRVADTQAVSLRVAYDRETLERRLPGKERRVAPEEDVYRYNSLFKGARLFLYDGTFSAKDLQGQAGILRLYACAKLEAGVRYRLTWACWPVGAREAVEVSCEFKLDK